MKPIYHAEQIISAYETAMGLPEAMRMTNDDGTFKAAATQQHIDKVCEKALAAAKSVLDDPKATQEEVDKAWDDLLIGIWGLGITEGKKEMLNQLIAKADWMMENSDKYVKTHWEQLEIALEQAKKVSADGDALQDEVDEAANALQEAIWIRQTRESWKNW